MPPCRSRGPSPAISACKHDEERHAFEGLENLVEHEDQFPRVAGGRPVQRHEVERDIDCIGLSQALEDFTEAVRVRVEEGADHCAGVAGAEGGFEGEDGGIVHVSYGLCQRFWPQEKFPLRQVAILIWHDPHR